MAMSVLVLRDGSYLSVSSPASAVSSAFAAGPDILKVRVPTRGSLALGCCLTARKAVSGGAEQLQYL